MSAFEVFETIEKMRKNGEPFCVVTVVRTADVTSAKAGAKAIVTREGAIDGHLGGACIQRAVQSAAETAMSSGEAQLIRVKPSEDVHSVEDTDGVALFKSGCPSGGTVELLIETYRAPPMILIFGTTAIAKAVAAHAQLSGFRVAVSRDALDETKDHTCFDGFDIAPMGLNETDYIVIASQGVGDTEALLAAFESKAGRISMVASQRKAQTLLDRLSASAGFTGDTSRLKSPAGLDLGAVDPTEIAVSIIAEIIGWRRLRSNAVSKPDAL